MLIPPRFIRNCNSTYSLKVVARYRPFGDRTLLTKTRTLNSTESMLGLGARVMARARVRASDRDRARDRARDRVRARTSLELGLGLVRVRRLES